MKPDRTTLEAELDDCTARIDAAYQAFCVQARAKPPVVPQAYARRKELCALLNVPVPCG